MYIIIIKGLRPPSDSSNSCLEREVIHCHLHAIMKKERKQKTEEKNCIPQIYSSFSNLSIISKHSQSHAKLKQMSKQNVTHGVTVSYSILVM